MLHGRGMNVLQITAYLPQTGEAQLLASPPLGEAARLLDGSGMHSAGGRNLSMGAAFRAPSSPPTSAAGSPDATGAAIPGRGRALALPPRIRGPRRAPA